MASTSAADNPYLSIWWHPRATIRRIVDTNPRRTVLLLVSIAALVGVAGIYLARPPVAFSFGGKPIHSITSEKWRRIQLYIACGCVPFAIASLYGMGALIRWSGSLMGGSAKSVEVRAAIAWPKVIAITGSLISLVGMVVGLVRIPEAAAQGHISIRAFFPFEGPIGAVVLILSIWWVVVYLACIAEVHRFSTWKALAACVIAWLALFGSAIALAIVVSLAAIPFIIYYH